MATEKQHLNQKQIQETKEDFDKAVKGAKSAVAKRKANQKLDDDAIKAKEEQMREKNQKVKLAVLVLHLKTN